MQKHKSFCKKMRTKEAMWRVCECMCFPKYKSCIQFIQYKETIFILRVCLLLFMLLQQCFFYEMMLILVIF